MAYGHEPGCLYPGYACNCESSKPKVPNKPQAPNYKLKAPKLEIEKPQEWDAIIEASESNPLCYKLFSSMHESELDYWWDTKVQPKINAHNAELERMLEGSVELFNRPGLDGIWNKAKSKSATHRAWLIGIEPIEKDTPEQLLRRLLDDPDNNVKPIYHDKAKKVLDDLP